MDSENIQCGSRWFVVENSPWNTKFKVGDIIEVEKIENDEVYFKMVDNLKKSVDQTWVGYKHQWRSAMTQFR